MSVQQSIAALGHNTTGGGGTSSGVKPLIIFTGESNSGGYADDNLASAGELGDRPSVKILNNTTLTSFDTLHISSIGDGVDNTHVGHVGAEAWGPVHGWELEMANRAAAGTFGTSPCYIVKTGQGGTAIAHWLPGAVWSNGSNSIVPWTAFNDRVDAAISLLTAINGGIAPPLYIFYSQGINDALGSTPVSSWQTSTLAHFDRIRTKYPGVPIFMTQFQSITSTDMSGYNTAIANIAGLRTAVYPIDTSGLATKSDHNHWQYSGMKTLADRLMDTLKANYTI